MTIYGRLPEELHEAWQIECIVFVRFQQAIVYELSLLLKLILGQHGMIHIVFSVKSDQISHCDQLLVQFMELNKIVVLRSIRGILVAFKEKLEQGAMLL